MHFNSEFGEFICEGERQAIWAVGNDRAHHHLAHSVVLFANKPHALFCVLICYQGLTRESQGRVVVIINSASDVAHCEKILQECRDLGMTCKLRVLSAHKGTEDTVQTLAEYAGKCVLLFLP